jgi:hypothetical protein
MSDEYMDSLRADTSAAAPPPSRLDSIETITKEQGAAMIAERRQRAEQEAPQPEPERRLPEKAAPHSDELPTVKHRFKDDGPVSLKQAAEQLKTARDLRASDPDFAKRMDTLDSLEEHGSDKRLVQESINEEIKFAEQKRAMRLAGLLDEPAEQQARDDAGRFAAEEQPEISEATLRERAAIAQEKAEIAQQREAVTTEAQINHVREIAAQAVAKFQTAEELAKRDFKGIRHVSELNEQGRQRLLELAQMQEAAKKEIQFAQVAHEHLESEKFQTYAKSQDEQLDRYLAKIAPTKQEQLAIQQAAADYMREDLGLSDDAIAHAWRSDPSLRSFAGQKMLADLARTKLAEQRKAQARRNYEQAQWAEQAKHPVHRPRDSYPRVGAAEAGRELPRNFGQLSVRNQMKTAAQAIAKARGNSGNRGSSIV